MKVINKTTKVIYIGGATVLPGEFATITHAVAASDMVQHFAKIGKIALEPEDKGEDTILLGAGKKGKGSKNSGKSAPQVSPDSDRKSQEEGASEGSVSNNGES